MNAQSLAAVELMLASLQEGVEPKKAISQTWEAMLGQAPNLSENTAADVVLSLVEAMTRWGNPVVGLQFLARWPEHQHEIAIDPVLRQRFLNWYDAIDDNNRKSLVGTFFVNAIGTCWPDKNRQGGLVLRPVQAGWTLVGQHVIDDPSLVAPQLIGQALVGVACWRDDPDPDIQQHFMETARGVALALLVDHPHHDNPQQAQSQDLGPWTLGAGRLLERGIINEQDLAGLDSHRLHQWVDSARATAYLIARQDPHGNELRWVRLAQASAVRQLLRRQTSSKATQDAPKTPGAKL